MSYPRKANAGSPSSDVVANKEKTKYHLSSYKQSIHLCSACKVFVGSYSLVVEENFNCFRKRKMPLTNQWTLRLMRDKKEKPGLCNKKKKNYKSVLRRLGHA